MPDSLIKNGGQEKKWLAYCVLTYNRPDIVGAVLSQIADEYQSYGIDIYYYDSSDNDDTYHVVSEYIERGYQNIYYVRVDSSVLVDNKMISILSGENLRYDYQYIWPAKDRSCILDTTLEVLYKAHEEDADAIFLGILHHPNVIDYPMGRDGYYEDAEEFYNDWGMLATSLDVTVFHFDKLLKGMNWEEFRGIYFREERSDFIHYATLFHSLAGKESLRIRVIPQKEIRSITIPGAKSTWRNDIFSVWIERFTKVNHDLPSVYSNACKEKVIRQTIELPWILGSSDTLILLNRDKILTPEIYRQYELQLPQYSGFTSDILEKIVYGEYQICADMIFQAFSEHMESEEYIEAYRIFKKNNWLNQYMGEEEYKIFTQIIEIYEEEIQAGSAKTIFTGVKVYKAAIQKYITVYHYIDKMNRGIEPESWGRFASYVVAENVSSTCLAHAALAASMEPKRVLDTLGQVFAEYVANNQKE